MKQNNKIFLILMLILAASINMVFAATTAADNSALCVYTQEIGTGTSLTSMLNGTYQYISAADGSTRFDGVTTITPTANFTIEKCEDFTAINATSDDLYWYELGNETIVVTNSTDDVLDAANYTVGNDTAGKYSILWGFDDDTLTTWNNTILTVCYNKTFVNTTDNLVDADGTLCDGCTLYETVNGTAYGQSIGIRIINMDLNNTDYDIAWSEMSRTCNAKDSCQSTRTTVFIAFGLIALMAIVGAAFLILSIINGSGMDMTSITVMAMAIVGLGIILIIGYYMIDIISNAICYI